MELAGVDVIDHSYQEELERTRISKEGPAKTVTAIATEAKACIAEASWAVTFLMAADSKSFLPLWAVDLRQNMMKGQDNSPKQ